MRELLLMRHAEAAALAVGGTDYERPLTVRGAEAAKRAARRLGRQHGMPDYILFSPAERTARTAQLVHGTLGLGDVPLLADPRIYLATQPLLLDALRELPADVRRVLLVGHNPAISELAQALAPAAVSMDLAPAEFRLIQRRIARWSDLERTP
jgi:phosphohistidine phosphatase